MTNFNEVNTTLVENSNVNSMQSSDDVKVIRRYSNRKLYDTTESSYITLSDVYAYLENGDTVKVINNNTKEDITTSVLLNALVEKGKKADKITIAKMLEFVASYIKGGSNGQE